MFWHKTTFIRQTYRRSIEDDSDTLRHLGETGRRRRSDELPVPVPGPRTDMCFFSSFFRAAIGPATPGNLHRINCSPRKRKHSRVLAPGSMEAVVGGLEGTTSTDTPYTICYSVRFCYFSSCNLSLYRV